MPTDNPVDRVVDAYRRRFGSAPECVVRAPGRVNLLGAHVDYSEGSVMPAAIDRAIWIAAAHNESAYLEVEALDLGEHRRVEIDPPAPPIAVDGRPVDWVDYPRGLAWSLRQRDLWPGGMNAVFGGDLPRGAGVSSSAAVEMAFLLAWEATSGFEVDSVEKAKVGVITENQYIGVASGIMDQYASLHGQKHHLLCIDCRTLEHDLLPLPDDLVVVVTDTGVRRRLVESDFNDRRSECQDAVMALRAFRPDLETLRDLPPSDLDLVDELPEPLCRRARHVVTECDRVRQGREALRCGDLDRFAELVQGSHVSSRDLYDVSIPELDLLAEVGWGAHGCYGSRLTGAGFGGCVVTLASRGAVEDLIHAQRRAFRASFDSEPTAFVSEIAAGAEVVRG